MILEVLLAIGGPLLQVGLKLIPLFYQWKILKTEAEVRELERRFKEAIKQAEDKAKAPDNIKNQYDAAKDAAKKKWDESQGQIIPSEGVVISVKENIIVNEPFFVTVSGIMYPCDIYADKRWILGTVDPGKPKQLLLTSAGSRTLDVKTGQTWVSKPIMVKEKV